jgi:hypothetical protein
MINVYDETGTICSFPSCDVAPYSVKSKQVLHYVVDEEKLGELKKANYPLQNIAVVTKKSLGRHDVEISTLKWAYNPRIPVYLYHDLSNVISKHF